jgi:hypothetical protein
VEVRRIAAPLLLGAAVLAPAACVPKPPPNTVYVNVAPPKPIEESQGVSPGTSYVWTKGYYRWDGTTYIWVDGGWKRPPRAGAVWISGTWKHSRKGWYWVEGRWS